MDGNFKLKGKQRHLDDVELMPGLGAFVEEAPYQSHIANHVNETEVCVYYTACKEKISLLDRSTHVNPNTTLWSVRLLGHHLGMRSQELLL